MCVYGIEIVLIRKWIGQTSAISLIEARPCSTKALQRRVDGFARFSQSSSVREVGRVRRRG